MAIQGSPVKSRYHRYQADTITPFISAGVNHFSEYPSFGFFEESLKECKTLESL